MPGMYAWIPRSGVNNVACVQSQKRSQEASLLAADMHDLYAVTSLRSQGATYETIYIF